MKTIKIGDCVKFNDVLFEQNSSPLFSIYKDKAFMVIDFLKDYNGNVISDYVLLKSNQVKVHGGVSTSDLTVIN